MDRKTFISSLCPALALASLRAQTLPHQAKSPGNKSLVVYFSWSGNTRSIAKKIGALVPADLVELELERPYSRNYNTCLDEALRDQKKNARPKLKNSPGDIRKYKDIFLGYPNWWGSIPMPIASFLESGNFEGKNIFPFCSNGGGGLGQSISAITKLCPKSKIGNPLPVHYDGGSNLQKELKEWIGENKAS